ncbi:hypothetical protein F5Y14DRAFT_443592 [Nemania sp. NC0429]|nr:hypothetical protein F5Y14DRAFT_443592 [Nemania sp. NC0429]
MSHGWTIGDGTFEPVPQDKRRRQDVPYPSFVGHSYRSRTALTSLQLAHDAPVSPCALDIACQHLWKCMPGEARKYLYISPPNGPALWGGNDESKRTAMYEKMDDKIYHVPVNGTDKTEYRHYADLKKRPWVIWPLWVEDQWGSDFITVIWHSEHAADDPDLFNQLVSYAIIDPRRSQEPDKNQRHQLVKGRLARIQGRLIDLWRKAGFNARRAKLLDVYCSPMPFDEATSGERCFAVVKELINQVINWYISGMQYHHGTTITSMSQWVNPFQQRVELAGICAWTLMASMDYNARIAVEAILPDTRWTVTSNGKEKYLHPYDLAGSYEEPPIASYDYLLPGGEKYMAPQTPKRGSRVSDRP